MRGMQLFRSSARAFYRLELSSCIGSHAGFLFVEQESQVFEVLVRKYKVSLLVHGQKQIQRLLTSSGWKNPISQRFTKSTKIVRAPEGHT
mmetsp:Transcript_51599/g.109735  ORF Transcript_51599/g.109735 Transcript_51599/m.109735 type:complete len:90 (-) Transcript_51599:360-629(-)